MQASIYIAIGITTEALRHLGFLLQEVRQKGVAQLPSSIYIVSVSPRI